MSSEIVPQVFDSPEFGRIRIVRDDGGEPWFVAKDVCDFFGVTNRNRVMQQLDSDEKGGTRIATPGGEQEVRTVTEAGLYHLLFILRPNEARGISQEEIDDKYKRINAFKRWVTHEVLPSIRRHGAYMTPEMAERMLNDPDVMIMTLEALKAERAKVAALVEDNARMLPKATAWDAMVESDGTMSVTKAARSLAAIDPGISRKRLFALLRADGIFCKRDCTPTRDAIDRGLAVQRIYENKGGHVRAYGHLTAKGLDWCRERYCRREVTPDA